MAKEDGDGAGYDVLSFDADTGQERWLEVKTTVGGPTTPFFLTRNEKAVAEAEPERFRLFRLYDFAAAPGAAPKLFTLAPPLDRAVTLEPETWRAGFGSAWGLQPAYVTQEYGETQQIAGLSR